MRRIILSNRRFCIFGCIIFLVVSLNLNHHQIVKKTVIVNNNLSNHENNILKLFRGEYIVIIQDKVEATEEIVDVTPIVKPKQNGSIYTVSGYDLSVRSTGKSRGNSGYGVTASGYSLKGKTLASSRVVAVDPNLIPIGSKIKITFIDEKYKKYNNVYYALDKGGLIKGKKLDLFLGDFGNQSSESAKEFGLAKAYIEIIKE